MKSYACIGKKKSRGFSIIEALIALIIIMSGFLVVISVVAMSMKLSTQSRDRAYAYTVCTNLLEKIKKHRYGDPKPASWETKEYTKSAEEILLYKDANVLTTEFEKKVDSANGSFFGAVGDSDTITITITWYEGTGVGGSRVKKEYKVKTEVRRSTPDES